MKGFSPNLVCALLLWKSGLGFAMDKFCQFSTVMYPLHDSGRVLSFYAFFKGSNFYDFQLASLYTRSLLKRGLH